MHRRPVAGSAWAWLALAWVLLGSVQAVQRDQDQPLEVEADSAEFLDREQMAIYRGGVVAVRGSQRLTGDEVHVQLQRGTVTRLVATGRPATFQMRHPDGEMLRARAARMEYRAGPQTLVLTGDAQVVKGDKTIEAERIVYHLDTGAAEAEAPEGKRVRTILVPKSDGGRHPTP